MTNEKEKLSSDLVENLLEEMTKKESAEKLRMAQMGHFQEERKSREVELGEIAHQFTKIC